MACDGRLMALSRDDRGFFFPLFVAALDVELAGCTVLSVFLSIAVAGDLSMQAASWATAVLYSHTLRSVTFISPSTRNLRRSTLTTLQKMLLMSPLSAAPIWSVS